MNKPWVCLLSILLGFISLRETPPPVTKDFSIGKVLLIVICQFLKRLAILSICCSDSVLAERLGSIPAFSRINRSIRSWVNPEKAFLIDLSVLERLVSSFFKEPNFF